MAWSSYTVLLRKWGGGRAFLLTASVGSVFLSGLWLFAAGWPDPPPPAAWAAILAWERAVSAGEVALLGAMAYFAPFLSAFFLWLIRGERIGLAAAGGMVLIVAGGAAAA